MEVIPGGIYRRPAKMKKNHGMQNNFDASMHKHPGKKIIGFSAIIIELKKYAFLCHKLLSQNPLNPEHRT
jgi:hypothetical protein